MLEFFDSKGKGNEKIEEKKKRKTISLDHFL